MFISFVKKLLEIDNNKSDNNVLGINFILVDFDYFYYIAFLQIKFK